MGYNQNRFEQQPYKTPILAFINLLQSELNKSYSNVRLLLKAGNVALLEVLLPVEFVEA